jgi:hypothetical protein
VEAVLEEGQAEEVEEVAILLFRYHLLIYLMAGQEMAVRSLQLFQMRQDVGIMRHLVVNRMEIILLICLAGIITIL